MQRRDGSSGLRTIPGGSEDGRVDRGDCSPRPPCRSGRAGLPHPAPRITGSLHMCSPPFAIRRSSGDTVTTRARCLAVFPFDDSVIRRSPSLHWLPRATVRQLHRYYQSAPTSHRPSRPTPFRSLRRYHGLLFVARQRGVAVSGSSSVQTPVPQSSAFNSHSWRRAGSPRFLGNPFANMPCSSTPADRVRQGH
jgi:hypothetical protein